MSFKNTIKNNIKNFIEHPQLWLTVLVTVAIFFSYIYIANRFINIARDAQDELVNIRIGALHDAFVPLAGVLFDEQEVLRKHMKNIASINPTITDFFIVEHDDPAGLWNISVATDEDSEDTSLLGYDRSLELAEARPGNSFTVEEIRSGERYFRTSRAIINDQGTVEAVVVTRQAMSATDKRIENDIQKSVFVLLLVLLFLLLLFFRHARIIDYAILYKKLKEVDSMKDDFISMASHELRTPLTSIRGYADILKTDAEITSPDVRKLLDRIDISAKQLDQLIADILDVSRLEQGRLEINMHKVNTTGIIASVCDSLRAPAESKGLKMVLNLETVAKVNVDEKRLRQIVTNLLGNAIKYTHQGKITVSTRVDGGVFELRISDTGIGMTADEQKELFGKFWRASGDDVRKQKGTGLGLWITKQLVEQMGGKISVDSIKGAGSDFVVRFREV